MLQDGGLEPRYVLARPEAYAALCPAIAERFGRGTGAFESYQYVAIVVDPFRVRGRLHRQARAPGSPQEPALGPSHPTPQNEGQVSTSHIVSRGIEATANFA